jgi:CO dehydrogenase/acetyl-CoA synthase delta subunit
LAAKRKDKEGRKQLKYGSTNISSFSAFVNLAANISYTLALGSKEVYAVSSTWGPKMSNNRCPIFTMLTKQNSSMFCIVSL